MENIENEKTSNDENSFIFSLDNNKTYNILIPQKAIKFSNSKKIKIGNTNVSNGFYFNSNSDIINDNGLLNTSKIYDFEKNNELTEGLNKLTELEIFEINFN